MSVATERTSSHPGRSGSADARGPVIDACAFHEWPSAGALAQYIDPGWRDAIMREGDRGGPLELKASWLYQDPRGDYDPDAYPGNGVPGSDSGMTTRRLLDTGGCDMAILGYREGILATAINNYLLARVVTQAANRWTTNEWLARDERLYGLVLVCNAVPETAAADIREFGAHERMVGVALGANCLGRGYGHAVYHPIYEAAAELNLPVVIQAGSDAMSSLDGTPTAGGLPATYAQYATHGSHTIMGHVASMIMQGVFEKYPTLRVLCVGGGVTWLAPYAWRMDYWFKTTAQEAHWLKRLPSEYLQEHVRLGTHSLEEPRQFERFATALQVWPEMDQLIIYTSGYPARDWETPSSIGRRLPTDWHSAVFCDNALRLFQLERPPANAETTVSEGV